MSLLCARHHALDTLSSSIFLSILRGRNYYYTHFTDEEQDWERLSNLLTLYDQQVAEPEFNLESDSRPYDLDF